MVKRYKYYAIQNEMLDRRESQEDIARVLGITSMSVRLKLDGVRDWTISEIDTLCRHFDMDYYELFKRN